MRSHLKLSFALTALLCALPASAQSSIDLSKPFDINGCTTRAIKESDAQVASITQKYRGKDRLGVATNNSTNHEQDEFAANQKILDARKQDCANQQQRWQDLHDQAIPAKLAAAQAASLAAIQRYQQGAPGAPQNASSATGKTPLWGFFLYYYGNDPGSGNMADQEFPFPAAGALNTEYVSDVLDLSTLPSPTETPEFITRCSSSLNAYFNSEQRQQHIQELYAAFWYLGVLRAKLGISPPHYRDRTNCGGYGIGQMGTIELDVIARDFSTMHPLFKSREDAEQRRREELKTTPDAIVKYAVQVHLP